MSDPISRRFWQVSRTARESIGLIREWIKTWLLLGRRHPGGNDEGILELARLARDLDDLDAYCLQRLNLEISLFMGQQDPRHARRKRSCELFRKRIRQLRRRAAENEPGALEELRAVAGHWRSHMADHPTSPTATHIRTRPMKWT